MTTVWKTWVQDWINYPSSLSEEKSSTTRHRLPNELSTSFNSRIAAPVLVLADLCGFVPGIITITKEYK